MNDSPDLSFDANCSDEPKADDINSFLLHFEKLASVQMYDSDTLRTMQQSELAFHANRLQEAYQKLENDHSILTWEYNESQGTLTNFSRAAKMAHKLGISNLADLAAVAVSEISQYFDCAFGALFVFNPETRLLSLNHSTAELPDGDQIHVEEEADHFMVKLFFDHFDPFIAEYVDPSSFVIHDTGERVSARIPETWNRLLGQRTMAFPLHTLRTEKKREPLVLGGLLVGGAKEKLEAKDSEMASLFADLLSSSLHNAILMQKLNEMTIVDPLTGLFNRRHLIGNLKTSITQAQRRCQALSLIMLDIDHFKRVNDTYGHLAGDKVLVETAALLKRSVREDVDLPARYGGEEFIAVLPCTDIEVGVIVAERIRTNLRSHTFDLDGGQQLTATCSLGVAQYRDGENLETFIDRADSALYRAKKGGATRWCLPNKAFTGQGTPEAGTVHQTGKTAISRREWRSPDD